MKVLLLHPRNDTDPDAPPPDGHEDLAHDLGLELLWTRMAAGDKLLRRIAEATMLGLLDDPAVIRWRLDALADALRAPELIASLYSLAGQGLDSQRGGWMYSGRTAGSLLSKGLYGLQAVLPTLRSLRQLAERYEPAVTSPALQQLFRALRDGLPDDYLTGIQEHLRRLRFGGGMVVTARLQDSGLSGQFTLRQPATRSGWRRLLPDRYPTLRYTLPDRDEAGSRAITELTDDASQQVAVAVATALDHVLGFLTQLQWEAGFYLGCLNLRRALLERGVELALPDPHPVQPPRLHATGLRDPALALSATTPVIPNDLAADDTSLVVITGANSGGKSTLLRALGANQLMMQAGMFVAATSYRASVAPQVHTHFRREEDATLSSGKLDEELARASALVDRLEPGDLVLFNESFACTDEREGSEIAAQLVDSLLRAGIRVGYVTHMHTLATHYTTRPATLFLRPERLSDGARTFRILPGPPQPTSYGHDVYRAVFGQTPNRTEVA